VSYTIQRTQVALTNHEEEATTALWAGQYTVQYNSEVSRNEQERPQAEHGQVRKSSPRWTRINHHARSDVWSWIKRLGGDLPNVAERISQFRKVSASDNAGG
jgi:hypothetical protein